MRSIFKNVNTDIMNITCQAWKALAYRSAKCAMLGIPISCLTKIVAIPQVTMDIRASRQLCGR